MTSFKVYVGRLLCRNGGLGFLLFLCILLTCSFFIKTQISSSSSSSSLSLSSGRRTFFSNDPSNPLGLNGREARLANRVRDMEDQNQMLRRQLSISQYQLMKIAQVNTSRKNSPELKDSSSSSSSSHNNSPDDCHNDSGLGKCEILDIAIVCAGYNSSRTVVTLIKSILFYRKHPIHFHFITDSNSKKVLETLFRTWEIVQVKITFYLDDEDVINEVSWIPNKHYSGIYGLLKLTLPKILPKDLSKIIVLDTDVTLANDIALLWRFFKKFEDKQSIGLVENQSDWYIPGKLWKSHQPWPALGRGFNTGVILLDLNKLRNVGWNTRWKMIAEKDLVTLYVTSLADQDIFNAVIKSYPEMLFKLPCNWNVQLSDHSRSSEFCYSEIQDLNIIHFNSPKKLQVKNKHVEFFRNHFLTFIQYDGNLLRRDLIGCNVSNSFIPNIQTDIKDSCYEFRRAGRTIYRTHLYFLDYDNNFNDSVTLVAQLSMDRLHMIESLATQWPGPISLALYLSDAEAQEFLTFTSSSLILNKRKNIGYHIVFKEGSFYPVNYLRNVALKEVNTDFVFLSDIDFLPGSQTFYSLENYLKMIPSTILKNNNNLEEEEEEYTQNNDQLRTAFIVPAFETQRYRLNKFPDSKAEVINLLDEGTLLTFRYHIWLKGHSATDYAKWRTATKPYQVNWEPDYEPYIVARKDKLVEYDTRFVGFGWNKVSHIIELHALNFKFIVLPNVFIIHMPHAPSLDIARYRTSESYRKCLKTLKKEFVQDINAKYEKSFQVNQ